MNPRRCIFACAIAVLAVLGWLADPFRAARLPASPTAPRVMTVALAQPAPAPVPVPSETTPARLMGWSRAEAVNYVRQYYAREQLRLELALGQERYRGQYWQAEAEWPELQRIEERRVAAIRELTAEMNELLAEICPGGAGEPLRLEPLFSLDQPAPNLAFLDAPSREEMETAMLGLAAAASLGSDHLLAVAEEILSEEEFLEYSRWNAPMAASLRNRLAGFEPDEGEFGAILQWQAAAGSDQEAGVRAELERRLGSDRLARLDRQMQPEVSTAVQDLRRVGLPLDHAAWLADFRSRASQDLQQLWGDPQTTDAQKQAQVGFLLAAFRMKLATRLGPRAAGAELLP